MTPVNKVAIITGASKGIGYGIAEALIRENINVVITGRHQNNLDNAVDKLNKLGNGDATAMGIVADVRNYDDQASVVQKTLAKWKKVDIVIANAGIGHFASIENLSLDQWHQVINTNLTGTFHTIKAAVEALKASQGYFITIASLAGTNFFSNGSAYNASKFGVVGFSQAVMLDLRQYGIKVSTIMPGSVASYFNNHEPSPEDNWKIQPEDIGELVVDILRMNPRTLPSKIEVRPTMPPKK